jgi:hypothetical protein
MTAMPLHEETTSNRTETVNRHHKTYNIDHTYSLTDIWNMTFLKQCVQNNKVSKTGILQKNCYRIQISYVHVPVMLEGGWCHICFSHLNKDVYRLVMTFYFI